LCGGLPLAFLLSLDRKPARLCGGLLPHPFPLA
jgi:hypothetical protein